MTLLPAWLRWVLPLITLAVLGFLSAYLYSSGALAITPFDVLAALKAPNSMSVSPACARAMTSGRLSVGETSMVAAKVV